MADFKILGLALVLLLLYPVNLPGVDSQLTWQIFSADDMVGLRALWDAWRKNTPYTRSNLLNWHTPVGDEVPFPCYSKTNWRGVTCLRSQVNATLWETWVVGLELDDASISGTLPPEIKQLTRLVYLKLTGNPSLGGPLPQELSLVPLNVLDIQDNGFIGTIPPQFSSLGNLLELYLSGNKFSGDFPFHFFGPSLQVCRIARNLFGGTIPVNAFENMTQLLTLDISGNAFSGPPPYFSFANSTLRNLNLSRNSFINVPQLSSIFKSWLPQNILQLDLSGLNIGGSLPADWRSSPDLLKVKELYLDDTKISGVLNIISIQSGINNLTSTFNYSFFQTLNVLSVKNNFIVDVIYDKQFLTNGTIKFYLQGNPYCSSSKDGDGKRCFCEQYCAVSAAPKTVDVKAIVIPTVISGVILAAVIICLALVLHRKNKYMNTLVKRFDASGVRAKRYEYHELRTATKNFAEDRKLGEGAFGAVFKGVLTNNTQVAVKQLFMKTQQASEDFLNEVLLITNLQHRNLVALLGYCLHGKEMLLVYELVDHCDLDKLLFQDSRSGNEWDTEGWPARKHICLGVAQGLYYLHASSQTKIIHRDIKASNILLDKNMNAKIADFGLARPIQDERTEIITQTAAGTIGYLAPEYVLYGQLSEKADVYSFGVLLLEIVSGTRNKDPTQPEDDIYLPTRAGKLHMNDRLMEVMDSRLRLREGEAKEVRRVLETAVLCVQPSPGKRPTMFRVVALLAGDADDVDADDVDADIAVDVPFSMSWPEYQIPSRINSLDPLLVPSSSSSTFASDSRGPFANGPSAIELRSLMARHL